MAVEVGNSSSPPILPPADGNNGVGGGSDGGAGSVNDPALGYSRHYAKKIHDLGKSSRETWIQTLVDHVLHGPRPNRPHPGGSTTSSSRGAGGAGARGGRPDQISERSSDSGNEYSPGTQPRGRKDNNGFDLVGATSRRDGRIMSSLKDSPYQPKTKIAQEAPVYLRKIVSTREGYTQRSRDGSVAGTPRNKTKDKDDATNRPTSSYKSHHYPPIRNAMFKEHKIKFIPQELASSPYIGHRQSYQVVPIEKVMAPRGARDKRPHTRHASTRTSSNKDTGHSAAHAHAPHTATTATRTSNPYLASAPPTHYPHHHQASSQQHPAEAWRPQVIPTNTQMMALEKRAKTAAQKAIKESKIFTCEGPYPVDAYVRFSMRKRGWVEKFAPRIHNAMPGGKGTADKLECELDEDFDVICDHNIPAPWEEEHGVYAMMSRLVRHRPARFIWAGRAVNSMILHQDVIVNHFPKARHFSSKTGIASSLRDLPWLASSDPMDFFPRCYLLSEDERDDLVEDFRMSACISLLKWVMSMFTTEDTTRTKPVLSERSKTIEVIHEEENETPAPPAATSQRPTANNEAIIETDQSAEVATAAGDEDDNLEARQVEPDDDIENNNHKNLDLGDDIGEADYDPDFASASEEESDSSDDDIMDKVSTPIQTVGKNGKRIKPVIVKVEKSGGEIPVKAVDWALNQCERFIRFKTHEDLDQKNKPNLTSAQWDQFLKWFYKVAHDGATVSVTESKVQKVKETLSKMKKLWNQYEIDGMRNLWIIKPGGKSKGIGIEFCNNLEDMIKYIENTTLTGTYVVQKYIETPCLIYKTKFDIRQWFVVTDWNPLTVWFYCGSYLRICSQEFTLDSMHEAIHLSNVAVQQFYMNGERTGNLPEDNYMDSSDFQKYLDSIGAGAVWDTIVYPGMKRAVINTLLATMDIAENKKSAFELYGADFMLSDNFTPWLLEINSSPGMAPTTKEKAKMCASVVEDLMKVVLDRREDKGCETGNFELVFKDTPLPSFKSVDNRIFIEGSRIRKTDLQRYASLDNVVNSGEDPSKNEFLQQLRKKHNKSLANSSKENTTSSRPQTRQDPKGVTPRPGTQRLENSRKPANKAQNRTESVKENQLTRSYTKIYGHSSHKTSTPAATKPADRGKTPRPDQSDKTGRKNADRAKQAAARPKKAASPEATEEESEEEETEVEEDDEEEETESEEEEEVKKAEPKSVGRQEESEEEEEEESEYETETEEEESSEDEEPVKATKNVTHVRKVESEDEHNF